MRRRSFLRSMSGCGYSPCGRVWHSSTAGRLPPTWFPIAPRHGPVAKPPTERNPRPPPPSLPLLPPRPPSSPAPSVGLVQRGGRKKEEEADASQREAGDEASSKSGNATREKASSRRFSPFEGSRDETDGFFGTHAYALLFACFVSIF
jgi:hypothetical protein